MKILIAVTAVLAGALAFCLGAPLTADGQTVLENPTWNALDLNECAELDPEGYIVVCIPENPISTTTTIRTPSEYVLGGVTDMGNNYYIVSLTKESHGGVPSEITVDTPIGPGAVFKIDVYASGPATRVSANLGEFAFPLATDGCYYGEQFRFCQEENSLWGTLTFTVTEPYISESAISDHQNAYISSLSDNQFAYQVYGIRPRHRFEVEPIEPRMPAEGPQVFSVRRLFTPGTLELSVAAEIWEPFYVKAAPLPEAECYFDGEITEVCYGSGPGEVYFRTVGDAYRWQSAEYVRVGSEERVFIRARCTASQEWLNIYGASDWHADEVYVSYERLWLTDCPGSPSGDLPGLVNTTGFPTPTPTITPSPSPTETPTPLPEWIKVIFSAGWMPRITIDGTVCGEIPTTVEYIYYPQGISNITVAGEVPTSESGSFQLIGSHGEYTLTANGEMITFYASESTGVTIPVEIGICNTPTSTWTPIPATATPSPTISRTPTEPAATPKPEPDGEAYLPIVTR